jgi:hypothetical protein
MLSLLGAINACRAEDRLPGITLRFECVGNERIGVARFQPESMRNMPPGALGCGPRAGKVMAFMPADVKGRPPAYVDIEWTIDTTESKLQWRLLSERTDRYSDDWRAAYHQYKAALSRYSARIQFDEVFTRELLDQVRSEETNTQLRLTVRFENGEVHAWAQAHKWR